MPVPVPEAGQDLLDGSSAGGSNNSSDQRSHSHNRPDYPLEPTPPSIAISVPTANIPDADTSLLSSSYYDPALQSSPDTLDMALMPMDMDTSASPADTLPSISTPASPPPAPPVDTGSNPPLVSGSPYPQPLPPPPSRRPYEYQYTFPESAGIDLDPYTPAPSTAPPSIDVPEGVLTCQCQCHEHILRELVRLNMTLCATSRIPSISSIATTGQGTGTIDTILSTQRGLQNLAETVIQCAMCAGNRVHLLTLVMVSIDGLMGVIEEAVAVLAASLSVVEYPVPKEADNTTVGSCGGGGGGGPPFKFHVEAYPLLVGGFRIPVEEKYTFIRHVLLDRLGGLLNTIRRIRFCMQEMLAGSPSRAQLLMMMETDRRLQVVIMRMRMGR